MWRLSICSVEDLRLVLAPSDPFTVRSGSFYFKPDFANGHWTHTHRVSFLKYGPAWPDLLPFSYLPFSPEGRGGDCIGS